MICLSIIYIVNFWHRIEVSNDGWKTNKFCLDFINHFLWYWILETDWKVFEVNKSYLISKNSHFISKYRFHLEVKYQTTYLQKRLLEFLQPMYTFSFRAMWKLKHEVKMQCSNLVKMFLGYNTFWHRKQRRKCKCYSCMQIWVLVLRNFLHEI